MQEPWDCLVVGAGPAGLAAATYLGRFRRSTCVVDAGDPRAAWIPVSHNLPGFPDGISGAALLARMRDQAGRYGARFRQGRVDRLMHRPGGGFLAHLGPEVLAARSVVLATGVTDNEPELPDLRDAVRRGLVRQCPICDAYEVIDQRVALIGHGECRIKEALLLRAYTRDLTVLTLGQELRLDEADRAALQDAGVRVLDDPVRAIAMENGRIAAWRFRGGDTQRFDTLYSALGVRMHSGLATALGAAADQDGALLVDAHQQTGIPGLYAAGDVVQGLSQVAVATGGAAIAATAINRSLGFPRA